MSGFPNTLSEEIIVHNEPDAIERLISSSYMSPQDSSFTGEGFACKKCDWYGARGGFYERNDLRFMCHNPLIRAWVEYSGCCNRFSYKGIHTD